MLSMNCNGIIILKKDGFWALHRAGGIKSKFFVLTNIIKIISISLLAAGCYRKNLAIDLPELPGLYTYIF